MKGTPGCRLVGPKGEVELEYGVIVAKRHAHFSPEDAKEAKIKNGQIVKIKIESEERTTIYDDVVCRVSDSCATEVYVDTDEANAAAMGGGAVCEIVE